MTTQRIVPVLVCADIAAAHDFLVDTFGFDPGGVHRDDNGEVDHAEVSMAGETIWLHRVAPDHGLQSVAAVGISTSMINVFVDDVDAHHAHSARAGATINYPPTDQPYGQREYSALDRDGRVWSFATRT